MYLRWMVRKDNKGVDLGIWSSIPMSKLSCPIDVHSGNTARKFNLLSRKQNDWKSVVELDENLRKMDPYDPVKYDFALFGYGVKKQEIKLLMYYKFYICIALSGSTILICFLKYETKN